MNLVRKAVRRANVQALQTGCREPEVVEWYYQYQSDLTKEASFMTSKHIIHMRHTLPGQEEGRTSYFHVSVSVPVAVTPLYCEQTSQLFLLILCIDAE